eukprot:1070552-Pelagomonas_calceolata.AAC.3
MVPGWAAAGGSITRHAGGHPVGCRKRRTQCGECACVASNFARHAVSQTCRGGHPVGCRKRRTQCAWQKGSPYVVSVNARLHIVVVLPGSSFATEMRCHGQETQCAGGKCYGAQPSLPDPSYEPRAPSCSGADGDSGAVSGLVA